MRTRFLAGVPLLLLLAVSCFAHTHQTLPASTDTDPKAQPANSTPAPKKVLTNDDLHKGGGVSVVGDKRNQNYHMSPAQPADAASISRIRKSLEKLTSQLDDSNQKLTALKNFRAGEQVKDGGRQINKGVNRVPVDQQIAQLETTKKKLESQIDDLLDEARKKGIDPGQLR